MLTASWVTGGSAGLKRKLLMRALSQVSYNKLHIQHRLRGSLPATQTIRQLMISRVKKFKISPKLWVVRHHPPWMPVSSATVLAQ